MTGEPKAKGKGDAVRPAALTLADYQALGAFRQSLRNFLAFSEAGARALSLTPQQHQALLAIKAHAGAEAITIGELAKALIIKNHSAVGLVERLVARDLVIRQASTDDRRRVLLALTPLGEQRLATISRNNLGELNRASPVFTELLATLADLEQSGIWQAPSAPRQKAP